MLKSGATMNYEQTSDIAMMHLLLPWNILFARKGVPLLGNHDQITLKHTGKHLQKVTNRDRNK